MESYLHILFLFRGLPRSYLFHFFQIIEVIMKSVLFAQFSGAHIHYDGAGLMECVWWMTHRTLLQSMTVSRQCRRGKVKRFRRHLVLKEKFMLKSNLICVYSNCMSEYICYKIHPDVYGFVFFFLSESTEGCNGLSGLFDEKRYSVGYTEACDL